VESGLARRAVPDGELLPVAMTTAREIAVQPLAALRATQQLLLAAHADALRATRIRENVIQMARLGSPENLAAIRAFQSRR
jgi:enoyl-CoA hydratase/carnithine racemase